MSQTAVVQDRYGCITLRHNPEETRGANYTPVTIANGSRVTVLRNHDNMWSYVSFAGSCGYARTVSLALLLDESKTAAPSSLLTSEAPELLRFADRSGKPWNLRESPLRKERGPVDISKKHVRVLRVHRGSALVVVAGGDWGIGWAKTSLFTPALPQTFQLCLRQASVRESYAGPSFLNLAANGQSGGLPASQLVPKALLADVDVLFESPMGLFSVCVDQRTGACGWLPTAELVTLSEEAGGERSPVEASFFQMPKSLLDGDAADGAPPRLSSQDINPVVGHVLSSLCRLSDLAFGGRWSDVAQELQRQPHLINVTRPMSRLRFTLLHKACEQHSEEAIRMLLSLGADTSALSADRQFPFALAEKSHHVEMSRQVSERLRPRPLTMSQLLRGEVERHAALLANPSYASALLAAAHCLRYSIVPVDAPDKALQAARAVVSNCLHADQRAARSHREERPDDDDDDDDDCEQQAISQQLPPVWQAYFSAVQLSLGRSYSAWCRFSSTKFMVVDDVVQYFLQSCVLPEDTKRQHALERISQAIGHVNLEAVDLSRLLDSLVDSLAAPDVKKGLVVAWQDLLGKININKKAREAEEAAAAEWSAVPSATSSGPQGEEKEEGMFRTETDGPFTSQQQGAAGDDDEGNEEQEVRWLAIGDWGEECPTLQALADGMAMWSQHFQPQFIMACGDNFYPSGVDSIDDANFRDLWSSRFLIHPELNIPWKVVLGNHDISGNWQAQIDFTDAPQRLNPGGVWQMRGAPGTPAGRTYTFSHGKSATSPPLVDFFAFDTTATQAQYSRKYKSGDPSIIDNFRHHYIPWLSGALQSSQAHWKVLFAHHPLYTMGSGHQDEARRLRTKQYVSVTGDVRADGWGLEQMLGDLKLDVYVAGHEHVMQSHRGPPQYNSIDHIVCGASIYSHFYGTVVPDEKLDWYNRGVVGFVAFTATKETLRIQFVDSRSQNVVHEVVRTKKHVMGQQQAGGATSAPLPPPKPSKWQKKK